MSDATDYLMAHAVRATRAARKMPPSDMKRKMRQIARVYHLLAREGALGFNISFLDDYRAAKFAQARLRSKGFY